MNTAPLSDGPTPDSLLQEAQSLREKGEHAQAAELLNRALTIDPNNAAVLHEAARTLLSLKKPKDALPFAQLAVQRRSIAPYARTLGEIAAETGDLSTAFTCYRAIVKELPKDFQALTALAQICERTGHRSLAIEYYIQAVQSTPTDMTTINRLQKLVPFSDLARVVPVLEAAQPPETAPLTARLAYEFLLVRLREYAVRVARGQTAMASSVDELFFTHAREDRDRLEHKLNVLLAGDKPTYFAAEAKGFCLISRGKRRQSALYLKVGNEPYEFVVANNIAFDDEFYQQLETQDDAALMNNLPPVAMVREPQFDDRPIIFLSCDSRYYRQFARPLLRSLNAVSQNAQVHIHIMNAGGKNLAAAQAFCDSLTNIKIAISAEQTPTFANFGEEKCYYHAIRFPRMLQCLAHYRRPLWLMDVDGLFNQDPYPLFTSMADEDIALIGMAARWEPWNQFNASMMGIRPTERGTSYLRLVTAYIRHFHQMNELRWGIDQLAMYSVYEYLRDQNRAPTIKFLPAEVMDCENTEEGIVWSNGGSGKFQTLEAGSVAEIGPPDSPRLKYLALLEKYEDEA